MINSPKLLSAVTSLHLGVFVVVFFLYRRTRFDPLWNQVVVGGVHNGER